MATELPAPVAAVIDATNAGDRARFLAAFTLDGAVDDWGRVFVLNYASEFITADLRLETYSHLQRLSLEYFGGKRTGDLISRINSDTGRLCNFLSINVVDFLADRR